LAPEWVFIFGMASGSVWQTPQDVRRSAATTR
jgi:hypothetical protein